MIMMKYFLIVCLNLSILLCDNLETSGSCKTTKFPPLNLHDPDQTFIYFNGTKILLKEENKLKAIHPITLKFTSEPVRDEYNYFNWKEGGQGKYRLYKEKIQDLCEEPCHHECEEADPNKTLCSFNAYLIGCPIKRLNDRKITLRDNCNETEPLMYIAEKEKTLPTPEVITKHNNFYYQLICTSSKYHTTHPFDKIIDMTVNVGSRPKTFVLMMKKFDNGKRDYGVCEYEIDEVIKRFNDFENLPEQYIFTYGVVVKDKENNWRNITEKQDEPISITNFSSVILLNKQTIYSMLNFELDDEEITHYKVINFQDVQRKDYHIHFFVTNHGRILKGISNENFKVYELFCDLDGEIKDVEIWENNRLLVLTTTKLYSLPLEACQSMKTCAKCLNDPYCEWNKENSTCIHVMKGNKNGNITENVEKYSRQGFSASPEVFCAEDKNSQDVAKDIEQLNKDYIMLRIRSQYEFVPITIESEKQTTKHHLEENPLMNESYIRVKEKNIEKEAVEDHKNIWNFLLGVIVIVILILLITTLLLNILFFTRYKSLRGVKYELPNSSEYEYNQGNDWLQRMTIGSKTPEVASLIDLKEQYSYVPTNLRDNFHNKSNEYDGENEILLVSSPT